MPDTDPVTELREAARLMRERASAASPGPWHHLCMGSEGCSVLNAGRLRDRKHVAFSGRKDWQEDHADAEHIASWSPPVAEAVADWLDVTAVNADCHLTEDDGEAGRDWTCDLCGSWVVGPCDHGDNEPARCFCWDGALAVARAYLGKTDD